MNVLGSRLLLLAALLAGFPGCAGDGAAPGESGDRAILYSSQPPDAAESLYMLDWGTRTSELLIEGDSVAAQGLASWSHGSDRIAYIRQLGSRTELHIWSVTDSLSRRLGEQHLPPVVLFPDWSPSDDRLLVSAGSTHRALGVYMVDVRTGDVWTLRSEATSYRCPSWSPEGDRFAVAAYHDASSAILVMDTLGVTLDTLVMSDTTYLDCPQWSPSRDEVLYTVFHGGGLNGWERLTSHGDLARVDVGSHEVWPVTTGSGLANYGRWSPDGDWIVFQSDRGFPPTTDPDSLVRMLLNLDIYAVRRDGSGLIRLTENTYFDAHPAW
jgi:Tol biopolymer transport system component